MDYPTGMECSALTSLKPSPRNARTHSSRQIDQLAASIKQFGFNNPIIVDEKDNILAGHGRFEASKRLGLKEVPIIRVGHLTEAQKRAFRIADNQTALLAGWDEDLLALELAELDALEFDITLTGFETGDIDRLIGTVDFNEDETEDDIPCPDDGPAITQLGDVWQIGPHRLICGDALNPQTYERLLAGARAALVFTDPPYNVPIQGNVSGLGKHKHGEFAMASGEMSSAQFQGFLHTAFAQFVRVTLNGAIHYICMDWRHMSEVLGAAEGVYTELKNLCVWAKSNGGMGSLYRSQHELVFVYKSGTKPHTNNVKLGKHGRNRTNVWSYAGANAFSETRADDLAMHPTVKPLELVKDAIRDCSNRGDIVLDAFCGSGTTLLAAHQTGRVGYGIELDPAYCDVILKRFLAAGLDAVHKASGEHFSNLVRELEHD